jgi:uncharacterized protein YlxP (DUF503 family)
MDYTTNARNYLSSLSGKLTSEAITSIVTELQKQFDANMTNDLINLGDVYRAAEAIGIDLVAVDNSVEDDK